MKAGRCPRCRGNLYLELDPPEGLVARKCLQCGMIESYFWIEPSGAVLVPVSIEHLLPHVSLC